MFGCKGLRLFLAVSYPSCSLLYKTETTVTELKAMVVSSVLLLLFQLNVSRKLNKELLCSCNNYFQ